MTADTPKKRRIPSVAACRAANSRDPNGAPNGRLAEIEAVARQLMVLPEDERLQAAMRFFPPSNLKAALYYYAKGDTPAEACLKSGCHPQSFKLYLESDNIGADLRRVMQGVLEVDYAPAAFRFLNDAVHDANMPARVRVDAAKILVDRAGFVAGPPAPQLYEKELENMSIHELQSHLHKLEASLKDVTPKAADEDGDSADDAPADDNTPPQPH
jgi:hypothetical protein